VVVELMSVEQKRDSVVFKVAVLEGMFPVEFNTGDLFIDLFVGDADGDIYF